MDFFSYAGFYIDLFYLNLSRTYTYDINQKSYQENPDKSRKKCRVEAIKRANELYNLNNK